MKYLNIACGNVFIEDNEWTNIDFTTHSPHIRKANLLVGLPFKENTFDVIYSSHFIEHIPKDQLEIFLSDCLRVLKPKGVIRLITPDLEFLAQEYLQNIHSKEYLKANFISALILDQCVRLTSGGNLAKLINKIKNVDDVNMQTYVKQILGEEIFKEIYISSESQISKAIKRIKKDPKMIINIFSIIWIRFIIKLLPKSFRNTNVSLAAIGERHMWVYDFYTLRDSLKEVGFSDIQKTAFNESTFKKYVFNELDIHRSLPRKGLHQIFLEATK